MGIGKTWAGQCEAGRALSSVICRPTDRPTTQWELRGGAYVTLQCLLVTRTPFRFGMEVDETETGQACAQMRTWWEASGGMPLELAVGWQGDALIPP